MSGVPSCQLAVAQDGEVVDVVTLGDAVAGDDTRYVIFSCTKAVVASTVWQLLAEGSLQLDDRIAEHIPEFGENGKEEITLEQVLQFYSRGGDFGTPLVDLDGKMKTVSFNASDIAAVAAFLRSLTDERVRNQSAPFDHPSIDIPHGAEGTNLSVAADPTTPGKAADAALLHLDATGKNGGAPLLKFTDGLQ